MTVYCIPRCASLPCNLTCSSFPAAHQVRYELQLHELSTIADGEPLGFCADTMDGLAFTFFVGHDCCRLVDSYLAFWAQDHW